MTAKIMDQIMEVIEKLIGIRGYKAESLPDDVS
jgi:hypothetical protein